MADKTDGVLGQIRWPNEIMWSDEQKARQGWLAVVSHEYLRRVAELLAADEEYDAAYADYEQRDDEWETEEWNAMMQRYAKAKARRAAAIRAMRA